MPEQITIPEVDKLYDIEVLERSISAWGYVLAHTKDKRLAKNIRLIIKERTYDLNQLKNESSSKR